MREQLAKMYGDKGVTDIASVAAWDGTALIYMALKEVGANADGIKYVDAMKGKTLESPRGPIMIDPVERDIVQNIYIRRIDKVDGKLVNTDIASDPDGEGSVEAGKSAEVGDSPPVIARRPLGRRRISPVEALCAL